MNPFRHRKGVPRFCNSKRPISDSAAFLPPLIGMVRSKRTTGPRRHRRYHPRPCYNSHAFAFPVPCHSIRSSVAMKGCLMTAALRIVVLASLLVVPLPAASADEPRDGFVSLFDGKTLNGWSGNPDYWSVRDGAITGETTAENPLKEN